jgi:hypothetical protein
MLPELRLWLVHFVNGRELIFLDRQRGRKTNVQPR